MKGLPCYRAQRQLAWLWGGTAALLPLFAETAGRLALAGPACLFKSWTGLPCPSCGSTRAVLALARLDPIASLRWNPLAAAAAVFFIVGGITSLLAAAAGRTFEIPPRFRGLLRPFAVLAVVANWAWLIADGR